MRIYTWFLFGAFLQDRVLVFPPYYREGPPFNDAWLWTDGQYCGNATRNPDCYFEPFSRCQAYVTEDMARTARSVGDVWEAADDPLLWLSVNAWSGAKWFMIEKLPHSKDKDVKTWLYPKEMRYLARLNRRTHAWASEFLRDSLHRYSAVSRTEEPVYPAGPPDQAICMHVRQSDKVEEMELRSVAEYLDAAEGFREKLNVTSIFVTTESPAVLEEIMSAETAQRHPHFTFYYTKYERVPGAVSVMNMARMLGQSYLALVSLSNLYLGAHPNCVAFVETLASNWCSLINDFRVTDGKRSEPWRIVDFAPSLY